MARIKDREKALELRKKGMSYSQIKKLLKVSKSTLSLWLRDYPLSRERIRELRDCNEQRIERCRETKIKNREQKLKNIYNSEKIAILPLSKRELYIAGLFLYWGEGSKIIGAALSISNSDPTVLKFFISWATRILVFPKERLKVYLQLYNDMDVQKELNYWSELLNIPLYQFSRPYIKKTSSQRINHKGSFGHGTCQIRAGDVNIANKVLMGLRVVRDNLNRRP